MAVTRLVCVFGWILKRFFSLTILLHGVDFPLALHPHSLIRPIVVAILRIV